MKASTIGLCVLGFLGLALVPQSVQAQCCSPQPAQAQCCSAGYSAGYYAPQAYAPMMAAPMAHAPMVAAPMAQQNYGPATVAYVNRLGAPINRGTYSLMYAIHLTDGRILLSDFVPNGHTVRGTEHRMTGGRKVAAAVNETGSVTVKDPLSNQTIATFEQPSRL